MKKPMSSAPELYTNLNAYLHAFLSYFEAVLPSSAGKNNVQQEKCRTGKPSRATQASPDCLHLRASVRTQNGVRRNPAP